MTPSAPAGIQDQRGVRDRRGLYDVYQHGRLAFDGSVLDKYGRDPQRGLDDYVWATGWQEPGCQCIRVEFRWLVGARERAAACHGYQAPPPINPHPLSAAERAAIEAGIWPRLVTALNVPPRLYTASFEASQDTAAVRAVREFLDDPANTGRCLNLLGPTGVGKTYAAVCGLRRAAIWRCRPERTCYWPMAPLARQLLGDERDPVLDDCLTAEFLVLDDVGGTYVKQGGLVEALLEELLCEREAHERRTLLTSNLPAPALMQALGDRVADRLRGDWGVIVSLPGESLRRKRGAR